MGTSSPNGGPGNSTPLVPSWLDAEKLPPVLPTGNLPNQPPDDLPSLPDGSPPDAPPETPEPEVAGFPARFQSPRRNFTDFARSGGSDRRSLGRAVSQYVVSGAGGSRNAARRMGSSVRSGAQLASFLTDVQTRGAAEALRLVNLESLAGRPIDEIFIALSDVVCPEGGTIDEGIARDAFVETIIEMADSGISDLDSLTPEQVREILEIYCTHAIEARIFNDVGTKGVFVPETPALAELVQQQLRDFIRRGVSDALEKAGGVVDSKSTSPWMLEIFDDAFAILRAMGDQEASE